MGNPGEDTGASLWPTLKYRHKHWHHRRALPGGWVQPREDSKTHPSLVSHNASALDTHHYHCYSILLAAACPRLLRYDCSSGRSMSTITSTAQQCRAMQSPLQDTKPRRATSRHAPHLHIVLQALSKGQVRQWCPSFGRDCQMFACLNRAGREQVRRSEAKTL